MSFRVKTITVFDRQAKRLIKKFPSLKKELQTLIHELADEPTKGTSISHNCYKIRMAIASKGKGKSGGARVITHILFKNNTAYLLSIYDKSDIENLSDKEVIELLKQIPD
jgi:mRNA-degrading endonuclease RelE of RelBE toxin-antitoxin system